MSPLAAAISDEAAMPVPDLARLKREAWRRWRIALIRADELADAEERATVERIAERQIETGGRR